MAASRKTDVTFHLHPKDPELIVAVRDCLRLENKIGRIARGGEKERKYLQLQFGSRTFYDFLLSIGLMPAKSRTLKALTIPRAYFADFFRGCLDGDGNIDLYRHPESRHIQLSLRVVSASPHFLEWVRQEVAVCFTIPRGSIQRSTRSYILKYGKEDSIRIFTMIYYQGAWPLLHRKWVIAEQFMRA